ncbi:electron transport complex, RnfABCDGE type, G subunit [Aedoeadaptatus nemausensis]|uniref:Ion-translocating oxidoreductase complex subunit G n=1 Tax=Aedoeadaptatus nemausensis TaxID=2582829 RepID=A0A6V6Y063_9FIRM|nr:RnfABCDGE type electron transport complex subunit G [Peptoniphilus nemausensis]CAC9925650.1 electron transport complex, RnfABCDGE type, G subunit [Peptoniphilus nemausensis]
MANYFKTGFILLVISAVAAGALAVVNGMTVDVIAQAEFEKSVEAYQEIYGDKADTFEPIDEAKKAALVEKYGDIQDVFVAKKGDEIVGYGVNHKASGYGGEMTNAIGLLNDGTIAGFRNIQNGETPGIGTQITEPTYFKGFEGKTFKNGEVKGNKEPSAEDEIPLITGATVSSTAVLKGVNSILPAYEEISAE